MVGLQGAGKVKDPRAPHHSQARGGPLHGGRVRRREARQQRVVAELLAAGRSVVVDDTNPSPAERVPLVALARAAGVPVRAVRVGTPLEPCRERNAARPEPVPAVGLRTALARFAPPTTAEGFARVDVVRPGALSAPGPGVR